jgi:fluoride exporter
MRDLLVPAGVVVLGGGGALARFLLDAAAERRTGGRFPVGTLVVNLSGALLLGLLSGVELGGDALKLAGTAALGSFTTFSTWMLEAHRLAQDGQFGLAVANVGLSAAAGLAVTALGLVLGGAL